MSFEPLLTSPYLDPTWDSTTQKNTEATMHEQHTANQRNSRMRMRTFVASEILPPDLHAPWHPAMLTENKC